MHEEVEITNSACGEAHTAVTCLAHEMQQRLNPSAIIKFTATAKGGQTSCTPSQPKGLKTNR